VTVGLEQAPINRLDPEISRRTVRKRPRILAEPQDIEETDDTHRNPKNYNVLLQFVNLWYIRLRYLSLNLLKKTVKIINSMLNLNTVKKKDFVYLAYNRSKTVKKPNLRALSNFLKILKILKGNTFKVKPKPYNKRPIRLFIIDRKSQFR